MDALGQRSVMAYIQIIRKVWCCFSDDTAYEWHIDN